MSTGSVDTTAMQSVPSRLQYAYTTTCISSLPPEILQEIFLSHPGFLHTKGQPWGDAHRCTDDTDCHSFCWIAVSHVCRRWRAVSAIRCQPLWATFSVSPHPEWIAELLRRTSRTALVVNANMSADARSLRKGREASLELVLENLYRIHRLRLHTTCCLTRDAVRMLAGPAPILMELHLGGYLADRDMSMSRDAYRSEFFYFPRMLRAKNTPFLRRLSVHDAHLGIRLTEPCSSTLRELTLHMSPSILFPWPCLPELMDVLRMMPSLRILRLEVKQSCNAFSHGNVANLLPVMLPRVYKLTLRARAGDCIGILDVLDLPALAFLDISIWASSSSHIQQLAPILRSKFASFGTTQTLHIEGLAHDDGSRSLRLAGNGIDHSQTATPPRKRCLFILTFRYDPSRLDDVHTMFTRASPSKHVVVLYVKGEYITRFVWRLILRSYKTVPSLVAMGGPVAGHLLPLLRIRTPDPAIQSGPAPPMLPRLIGLILQDAQLDLVARTGGGTGDADVQDTYKILHGRAVAGYPFIALQFINCSGMTQSMAANLRHVLKPDGELEIRGCGCVKDITVRMSDEYVPES